jgi:small subunit ribosomal protein S1
VSVPGILIRNEDNPIPMTTDQPELATSDVEAPALDTHESGEIDLDLDTPVRALDGPEYVEVDGEMVPNYDLTLPLFSEGDVVTGRVVRVDKDEVLVDIGYKSEGVIPLPELSIRKSVKPEEEVSLGEWVDALVMQKEDQDGRLILSKKRARFEKAWKRIEAAAAAGEHVEGTVIEVVKGGLILDLGVRGFLPASLVDIRRVQDLDEFLGRKLECKVIELNRNRNNVVLSRRAVLEDERREVRQKILDDLQPGQVVEGVISNIVEFGAFVDLDGIDGLIHISELSWSHVNHPSEVLTIGEKVNVKVLDIDRDRQRISLGLKQTQADPWQSVIESYQVGDVVEGRVTKVVTFGAFVEIHSGVEGLVHISELAAHHVENPREVVNQGDVLAVRVIEIDADRRRLSLSLKRVADGDPIQHHLPDEIRNAVIEDDGVPPAADEADAVAEADPDADAIAVGEPATVEDEADAEAQAEAEPVAEAEAEPVVEVAVAPEPEAEAEVEAPAEVEVAPEAEAEVEVAPEAEAEVEEPAEPEVEAEADGSDAEAEAVAAGDDEPEA